MFKRLETLPRKYFSWCASATGQVFIQNLLQFTLF